MKKLSLVGLLLSTGLVLAATPACGGDDTGGDGDGDGDTTGGTAGDGDGDGTGGSDVGSGGTTTPGSGGAGTGGNDAGSGGSDVGSGGSDVGSGGSDVGSGGSGTASADCTEYCTVWFTKGCNAAADAGDYADNAACLTACASFATDVGECRLIHVKNAANADDGHCGHAAAAPTGICQP